MTQSQKLLKSLNLEKFEFPLFDENEMNQLLENVESIKNQTMEIISMIKDTDPVVQRQGFDKFNELDKDNYFDNRLNKLLSDYDEENDTVLGPSLATIDCNLWLSETEYDFIRKTLRDELKYTSENIGIGRHIRDTWLTQAAIKVANEGFPKELDVNDSNVKSIMKLAPVNMQSFKVSEQQLSNIYKLIDAWINQNGVKGTSSPKFDIVCNILERIVIISRVYVALKDRIMNPSNGNSLVSVSDYVKEMYSALSNYKFINNIKDVDSDENMFEGMTDAVVEEVSNMSEKKAKKSKKTSNPQTV
jgi:hypothetical protein